ncbi:hypothetical protein TTHERM_00140970 (macronuclear) [Tetrahymena thermophila SB210]|uniref:Uncharacterized protein n=1 Tax=Tetrahymena thermophila (strain SB210) TaxID=312017 RepID=I7MDR1_TETTS|nr:hypothetical protein TTHERM_00140970 [Tetrahymena thermophila SB210]EAR90789.2 hypothetical protein TTHERM_00140970 [Tetrahymena thermophila SB210]|eukprot:XP_001011034.2 hypothetical protein TTHERM_00140970 [Tetrahymena thermophila SB210]
MLTIKSEIKHEEEPLVLQKRANFRYKEVFDISNEYEKYVILDNISHDSNDIKRCSFRKITQKQQKELLRTFQESDIQVSDGENSQDQYQKLENNKENIEYIIQNSLNLQIYVNQSNNLQFKEIWKNQLGVPFELASTNLTYDKLEILNTFSPINYETLIKAQLLQMFPLTQMSQHPFQCWDRFIKDKQLLAKLCEIVTHNSAQGKLEQFQNHLSQIAKKQSIQPNCQQIKFVQDFQRKSAGNIISQSLGLERRHLKNTSLNENNDNNQDDINEIEEINKIEKLNSQKKQSRKSKYHGLSRLLLYSILDLFKPANMTILQIPQEIQTALIQLVKRLKKSGKFSIKKNSEDLAIRVQNEKGKITKTDFYNHSHYNALFLILNPTSIRQMRNSFKDVQIHKFVFGIDISNILLDQNQLAYINILKAYSYMIFQSSLLEFQGSRSYYTKEQSLIKENQNYDQQLNKTNQLEQIHRKYSTLSITQPISTQGSCFNQTNILNKELQFQKQASLIHDSGEVKHSNLNIRKKYLKRVQKSIAYLSQGIQVLRF